MSRHFRALAAVVGVSVAVAAFFTSNSSIVVAQQAARPAVREGALTPAPNRRPDEGRGPFKTLVIRGAMVIDGTGAPPQGPVDIVVEGNRIAAVRGAGTPGVPMRANRGPQSADL